MPGVQFYRDAALPFFELKICDANRLCYKKHSHEEYSLGVIDAGSSSFWYEGKTMGVNPQTVVLIPPGLVHSCNPQPEEQWKYKMLFIEAGWMRRFLENRGIPAFCQPVVRDRVKTNSCQALDNMLSRLTVPASPLEKEAAVMAFFEQAMEGMETVSQKSQLTELPRLVAIKQYIHENYRRKITLEDLEQVSGLNKFTIIRSFKEEFNIPPHMYQTLLRINNAKKMLRQRRRNIEVACETGFYDQSHFHKVFKSHTGVTPEQYQSC
jgi:AraC-like DNA-binding protein